MCKPNFAELSQYTPLGVREMISSVGGPHILLQKADLPSWGGVRNTGGRYSEEGAGPTASDYERASKVHGYSGVILVGANQAISFWGDRLDIGVISLSPIEILIVRIGTDIARPFQFAESLARSVTNYEYNGELKIVSSNMVIIDASESGMEPVRPRLEFSVALGDYKLLTHVSKLEEGALMVLHVLRRLDKVEPATAL